MKTNDSLLEKLREEIGPELEVVRPLRPASWRALWLLLIWLISVCGVLTVFGFRANYETLGPYLFWGFSGLQALGAYLACFVGLNLVIPGSGLPRLAILSAAILAFGLHILISLAAFTAAPFWPPAGSEMAAAVTCFTTIVVLSTLPAIAGIVLAARGLPINPLPTGLLSGLSWGLIGEAVWRMHCPVTSLGHVGTAHTGAVVVAVLCGSLLGLLWLQHATSSGKRKAKTPSS